MRKKPTSQLEAARKVHPTFGPSPRGAMWGYFTIRHKGADLRIIASNGDREITAWEHVSVSLADRCPTWEEMCFVKDLFWLPTETVVQFHPPRSKHINFMETCLHLWRHPEQEVVLPPSWTIA